MVLDKQVAEKRRFARLTGLAAERGSGLPVGPSVDIDVDVPVEPVAGRDADTDDTTQSDDDE